MSRAVTDLILPYSSNNLRQSVTSERNDNIQKSKFIIAVHPVVGMNKISSSFNMTLPENEF